MLKMATRRGDVYRKMGNAQHQQLTFQRALHSSPRLNFLYRSYDDVEQAGNVRKANSKTWESRRYQTGKDGLGYSVHHTILYGGHKTPIQYQNHVESVYIVQGKGQIEVTEDHIVNGKQAKAGAKYDLVPGALYALDGHEKHILHSDEDVHAICTFSPPVMGTEDHNEHGAYAATDKHGNKHWEINPVNLMRMIRPATSLQQQASERSPPKPEMIASGDDWSNKDKSITFRVPTIEDAPKIYDIVVRSGLDINSPYMYAMYANQFPDTCIYAQDNSDGTCLGFVIGHRPPYQPDTMFVWQVAANPDKAARGIGTKLLACLQQRLFKDGVNYMEASVTPSNAASHALFSGFAKKTKSQFKLIEDWVPKSAFPHSEGTSHEREDLYRIGPINEDALNELVEKDLTVSQQKAKL